MVKWFCGSTLCFNEHKSRDEKGNPVAKFTVYRRDIKLEVEYTYREMLLF